VKGPHWAASDLVKIHMLPAVDKRLYKKLKFVVIYKFTSE